MKKKKNIKLCNFVVAFFLFTYCTGFAQPAPKIEWYIEKIDLKCFQVDVTSDINIDSVTFSAVAYLQKGGTKRINCPFTDGDPQALLSTQGYTKIFYLDYEITRIEGITMSGKATIGKSDERTKQVVATLPPSRSKIVHRDKVWKTIDKKEQHQVTQNIQKPDLQKEKQSPFVVNNIVVPVNLDTYPCRESRFTDLSDWMQESNSNVIQVQVTYINQSLADGSHYYTAWGKSTFHKGQDSTNACLLTTYPAVKILFSDRETDNQTGGPGIDLQPFSIRKNDVHIIFLDLAKGTIRTKSVTWNFETTFSSLNRNGNTIYGIKEGKIIILNLLKAKASK